MDRDLKSIKHGGNVRIAEQEYAEAVCFLSFVTQKKITSFSEVGVAVEHYLLGICDLFGELSRYAVNAAIKKDVKSVLQTKEVMRDMYGALLQFDFRNGDLRRKFDGTKYEVAKIERLVLEQMRYEG